MNETAETIWRRMRSRSSLETVSLVILGFSYFLIEIHMPLNHDVAWLLTAGTRWIHGARLYTDIIENNPPLVFYVYGILTFGTFNKTAFIAAVIVMMLVSAFWAARLNGPRWGIATFALCVSSGITDFGQRDQLAAIVAIPYLLANRAGPRERTFIGIWSFVGFGLKPYLMLVPLGATFGRCLRDKNWRAALSPENVALGLLSVAYVCATAALYPQYFSVILPLTRLVYFAYGVGLTGQPLIICSLVLACVTAIVGTMQRELWPETGALIGAIGSFLIQGRFWSYHLIPAILLTFLLWLLMNAEVEHRRKFALVLGLIALMGAVSFQRLNKHYDDVIPRGATSVLFLSAHVWSAYPAVLERGIVNASRYPALWTLPGAWRLLHDHMVDPEERIRAEAVLATTRRQIVDDILRYCPDPIFVDARERKPYFDGPFNFIAFVEVDPRFTGYRPGERVGIYQVYRRTVPCPKQ